MYKRILLLSNYLIVSTAEAPMAKSFYNHYLESGNNVQMKLDDNAEHGFVNIKMMMIW